MVDLPFGIRGGLPVIGDGFPPQSMVLATADGHPLADAFISRIPARTLNGIERQPFYAALLNAEGGAHATTPAEFTAAARNARHLHIGWVLLWQTDTKLARRVPQAGAGAPVRRLPAGATRSAR